MPLLRELIDIPEKVQSGDFVLNLSTGLEPAAIKQTLDQYVVTPQLVRAFEDALSFIKSTIEGNQNRQKGAYLHGSFGSGKSHFMAVLHLLLQGNADARAINELAPVVHKHDAWLQSKNILLVPYQMIGAVSIEAGILGGYANYIAKRHPNAPIPGFYLSDRIIKDAENLRRAMGDDAFFKTLNQYAQATGDDDGWGEVDSGHWDLTIYTPAISAHGNRVDRARLVGDLVRAFFQSVTETAKTDDQGFVDFDEGLLIMTEHAKALGYDAVVLFLDELILWLASRISDDKFIAKNIQKVVKLVEASEPRALPVASFIARQRDLREFVGDQYTGAQQDSLSDALKYWDGRFHIIKLEDRNLPVIVQKRLLKPVSESARIQIDAAFDAMDGKMREEIASILLTNQGDREQFRSLYPFSPALVQALVALSTALQRERTALKVMLMLLVQQRDSLELGSVIPVGDLYDVIASETKPFSDAMRQQFENAKNLFERKLIPLLEAEHQIRYADWEALPDNDPAKRPFAADLRLVKTLLLSALVPEVECFKQLTATKLAALNHGTIKSPIPGKEYGIVLNRCKKWAGQVGEIKISDDAVQTIALQLSGVDTASILEQANPYDNDGARRKLVKDLLYSALGVQESDDMFQETNHRFLWRGTWRNVEVLFYNIREITDLSVFEARGDDWKVIIDYPFDRDNHTVSDDKARIQIYEQQGNQTRTLCWLPYFFSQSAQKDLGMLVRLEYVLKTDDRFLSFSKHLSPVDRGQARTLLENQRSQLRQRIKDYLMGAYGASDRIQGSLDDGAGSLESQIISLDSGFRPRLPIGSTLGKAFEQLLGQALEYQFPDHPEFDAEIKFVDLVKVFEVVRRAIFANNHRIDVDSPLRPLMRSIAQPLKLGEMHERYFIFKPDWPNQLTRELAKSQQGNSKITVKRLREVIDQPAPRGLTEHVQNLLIQVFAEYGQYAYSFHGGGYQVTLKDMPDNLELLKQDLAKPEKWKKSLDVAGELLGVTVSPNLTANNQGDLQKQVRERISDNLAACENLVKELSTKLSNLGQPLTGNRLRNAQLGLELLRQLQTKEGAELVDALAEIKPFNNLLALSKSITSAASVVTAIKDNGWYMLEIVWNGTDSAGKAIKQRMCDALANDELVTSMSQALRQAVQDASRLIPDRPPASTPPGQATIPTPTTPNVKVVKQGRKSGLNRQAAKALFIEIEAEMSPGDTLEVSYSIQHNDSLENNESSGGKA